MNILEMKALALSILMLFQLMSTPEQDKDTNKNVFGLDMSKIEQGIKETKQKEQKAKEEKERKEKEEQERKEREAQEERERIEQQEQEAEQAKQVQKKQATKKEEVKEASTPSQGGRTLVGTFRITAYCTEKYQHICGGGQGITASGTSVSAGRTIAVDTSIIPMGSRVYIEGIGERIAEDTGGAVNGYVIDLALGTHSEALSFGVQRRQVWLIG